MEVRVCSSRASYTARDHFGVVGLKTIDSRDGDDNSIWRKNGNRFLEGPLTEISMIPHVSLMENLRWDFGGGTESKISLLRSL